MTFRIEGQLTVDDYQRFNLAFLKSRITGGARKYIYSLIGIWMVGIFLMNFVWAYRDGESPFNVMFFSFIIFALMAYYLIYGSFFSKKALRRMFESDRILSERQRILIDGKTIEVEGESFAERLTPDNVVRILSDECAFYVFISKRQAYLFPSRYFADEDEFFCCRDFVIENFGKGNR